MNETWGQAATRIAWVDVPLGARHVSAQLVFKLVDGHYLAAWPRLAGTLPVVSLCTGFLVGWQHLGFRSVFSESTWVMMAAAVFGTLSAQLGLFFVIGFAVGDFFLADKGWSRLGVGRFSALIEYGLLSILTTTIPLLTKTLLAQLQPPKVLGRSVRFGLAVAAHVALTFVMVYFWAQSVPLLIRPVFTWNDHSPSVKAMSVLQEGAWPLALVAASASALRLTLQGMTAFKATHAARVDEVETELAAARPVRSLLDRVPLVIRLVARSLWALLLLAGMLQFWVDAALLGVLIVALDAARERLVPVPLGVWPKLVERVPLLFRLMLGSVFVYVLSRALLEQQMRETDTFRPIVVLVGLAMIVFFLLVPGLPKTPATAAATSL